MSKIKSCSTCNKEVAKSAKVCPHCGAKQKGGWLKKLIIIWIVIATGVAILNSSKERTTATVAGVDAPSENHKGPILISTDKEMTLNKVGITINDIKVSKIFSDQTGILTAEAQSGATLVAVFVNFENKGNEPLNPFSLPKLRAVSPSGVKYEEDLGKSAAYAGIREIDQKVLSDIAPGLRSQSVSVFEISEKSFKETGWALQIGSSTTYMYKLN